MRKRDIIVCYKTFSRPAQQETRQRIMCLLLSSLLGFDGFGGRKTKVWNLIEKTLYLQIHLRSILRKSYRLNPGCTKTLGCSNICNKYSPAEGHDTFYYDGSYEPYIWIHTNNTVSLCKDFGIHLIYTLLYTFYTSL